jgi:hypothetical protein
MAKNNKTKIIIGIVVIIIIILLMKGCNQTGGGTGSLNNTGGNNGGSSGGGTTVYIHDECSKCQARWMTGITSVWECSGSCTTGNCYSDRGDLENPFIKPSCTCSPVDTGDNCYSYSDDRVLMCGGTCVDTSKSCQMTITGACTCQTRPKMCSEITSIKSPSDCLDATCPITGQTCQFDTGRGICLCGGGYL